MTFLLLCLALSGCEQFTAVAVETVEASVKTNNAIVAELQSINDTAKAARKATLNLIAEEAETEAAGVQAIAMVKEKYAAVFDALQTAEGVQNALADALTLAQKAIDAGEAPDINKLLSLYADVQKLNTAVATALVGVQ